MLRKGVFACALLAGAAPVWAGETPLYEPARAWVKEAPAPDPAKLPAPRPQVLIFDQQQWIEDGRVSTYVRSANVIANAAMLNQAGTIRVDWQPDHGDVIVHHARLLRGGEAIDLLKKGGRFEVLKRELGMEQRMLTGILSAVMEVEGARVGDILDVAFTVTNRDPALRGKVSAMMPLVARPVTAGLARNRIGWHKDAALKLRGHVDGLALEPRTVGDHYEVELTGPIARLTDLPADAPLRFRPIPIVEASSFADWQDVSRTFAPLYATAGTIASGSPLAAEVARIRAAGRTPRERAALALQSVQGEVRYLFQGMAGGNLTPQAPARTWEVRYGDCKAKTLLLLAMLRQLDIAAEPVLANIQGGDFVPKRLPGAGAFDHVLIRATIDGADLWLDGTGQGARLADLDDTPPFRWVLPLRDSGATLMALPIRPNARPDAWSVLEIDQRAGVALPTPFNLSMTMRGQGAEMMRLAQSSGTAEQLEGLAGQITGQFIENARVVTHRLTFDEAANTGTLEVEGFAQNAWRFANGRSRRDVDFAIGRLSFEPDRSRTAWKAIPIATGGPETSSVTTRIRLPDGGRNYVVEGAQTLPASIGGIGLTRRVSMKDGLFEVEDRTVQSGVEIAPEAVAAERAAAGAAKSRLLRLVAPAGLPPSHLARQAALREGRLKPLMAMYDRAVVDAEAHDPSALDMRSQLRAAMGDHAGALADLDKAIEVERGGERLARRYQLLRTLGRDDEAVAAAQSAYDADPSVGFAVFYAEALSRAERYDEALALLDERIGAGGDEKRAALSARASVLARKGDAQDAIAAIDQAIADKPDDPDLYNERCWTRATLNVDLGAALADCDRSIALGINTAAALDSRAMVHLRAGRLEQARTDLDRALGLAPEMGAALYLRGIVRRRQGDVKGGDADIAAAKADSPRIAEDYDRWGVSG